MPIDMNKRTKTALISLEKIADVAAEQGKPVGDIEVNMVLAIDRSGSMEFPENRFYSGKSREMQELTERMLGLAMTGLDADMSVQVFPFHSYALEPFEVNQSNYSGALDKWIKKNREMGGTDYVSVIRAIISYARKEGMLDPGKPPVFVGFQTDGASGNTEAVKAILTEAAELPIFWQFIGLGANAVVEGGFLDVLDNLPNRKVDNVGKMGVRNVTSIADDVFYDKLLTEFLTSWLPDARAKRIVTV